MCVCVCKLQCVGEGYEKGLMCVRNISLCVPVPDSALYRSIIAPTGVWQQTDLNLFLCSSNNSSKVFKVRKLCVFMAKISKAFRDL